LGVVKRLTGRGIPGFDSGLGITAHRFADWFWLEEAIFFLVTNPLIILGISLVSSTLGQSRYRNFIIHP
jgi:hypothetical protein